MTTQRTRITRVHEWDMGHRVPNHDSACKNLHGHRYKVEISLEGDISTISWDPHEGMVMDFGHIKKIACGWIDEHLDHAYMYQHSDPIGELAKRMDMKVVAVDFVPTAEHIAAYLFHQLEPLLTDYYGHTLRLASITLYETPKNFVTYPIYPC